MTTDRQRIAEETAKEGCPGCRDGLYITSSGFHIWLDGSRHERCEKERLTAIILRALEHSEQGWVSVSEKLPENNQEVLVWPAGAGRHVLQTVFEKRQVGYTWQGIYSFYYPEKITHWRPLPVPPVQPESAQVKK